MYFGSLGRLAALLAVPVAVSLASCGLFHHNSAPAGTGQEVFDGKLAFIVTHVDTSPTFGAKDAHGVFLNVSMAVRNVGTEADFFEWGAQKLEDSTGRKYSASFMDPPRIGDVGDSIDPGLQVSLKLAFDVPQGTKPTKIVLHDSASSPGVPVHLTQAPSSSPTPANGDSDRR